MKIYYNLWYENIFIFKTKQKIYLLQENFKMKQSCKKFDYQKMRTFKIKWQTKSITFELELLKHFKIHFIIHIVLLELVLENTKFTKRAYFVSFHEKMSTKKVVYLFKWYIITNYKVSAEIISDKNTQFRLKFWQTLTVLKRIKIKMSTIKYSQINK